MKKLIDILIPTCNRINALAVTLTSLVFQEYKNFDIIISDQTESENVGDDKIIQSILALMKSKDIAVTIYKNLPNYGIAQQRQSLLEKSQKQYCLFLDDDVILEPWVVKNLYNVISFQRCGFVGSSVIGLSYYEDRRPHEQEVEFWTDGVLPEKIIPNSKKWQRHILHNAANLLHIAENFNIIADAPKVYKVAWVGGCVLYNRENLLDVGGFSFWKSLPKQHCGEDALAQIRVMDKYGGCGILPSGVYHQELKTTIPNRIINAPEYFINYEI